jgi:hypothetical protein
LLVSVQIGPQGVVQEVLLTATHKGTRQESKEKQGADYAKT